MRFGFLVPLALITLSARAQSTAFTYQGELKNGNQLASGLHDFRFRLFDAAASGAQIGTVVCVNNVSVADGVFSAIVDFGPQFVTEGSRFIEIEARRDTGLDCANATGFAVTGARQQLLEAPSAVHARTASALINPSSAFTPAVSASNDGKIGIGTSTPTASLHIRRQSPGVLLQDIDGSFPGCYVTYFNNSGVETGWFGFGHPNSPIMSVANGRTNGHITLFPAPVSGNVGIGTQSPAAKLDVRGEIRLGPSGQHAAVAGEEILRVVRGEINSAGTRIRGAGFTSSRIDLGKYQITLTQPFSTIPSIFGTAWRGSQAVTFNGDSVNTASAVVVTYSTVTDAYADASFEFMLIGPR